LGGAHRRGVGLAGTGGGGGARRERTTHTPMTPVSGQPLVRVYIQVVCSCGHVGGRRPWGTARERRVTRLGPQLPGRSNPRSPVMTETEEPPPRIVYLRDSPSPSFGLCASSAYPAWAIGGGDGRGRCSAVGGRVRGWGWGGRGAVRGGMKDCGRGDTGKITSPRGCPAAVETPSAECRLVRGFCKSPREWGTHARVGGPGFEVAVEQGEAPGEEGVDLPRSQRPREREARAARDSQ